MQTVSAAPIATMSGARKPSGSTWVVTGGSGPEREGSLLSGEDVSNALGSIGLQHTVIDLTDIETVQFEPHDVALLTTHGQFGEDGKLQGYLETRSVAYTGSGVLGSAMSMAKATTNTIASSLQIPTPKWLHITPATRVDAIAEFACTNGPRVILRPTSGGGSRGVVVVNSVAELMHALETLDWPHHDYLLNPYINGTEVSIAIVRDNGTLQHLPTLETEYIGEIYDYTIKHTPNLRVHHCPARIPDETATAIEFASKLLYDHLRLSGYARFDFLVDSNGTPWFLEVNALPGLSRSGNLAVMASSAHLEYVDIVRTQLRNANRPGAYRP